MGQYDLKGRTVLVTGGSRGIGESICDSFAREGSNLVINYVSNADRATALKARLESEYPSIKIVVIQADMGVKSECERLVKETKEAFGGVDVICSNAGWTKFSENFGDLDALSEEDWDKCWAVNVKAQLWLFRAFLPIANANEEGGVFLICSSVAGLGVSGSSMAYGVSKAAGLQLMRALASSQGPKVRVNAVLPGLVLTEWGDKFPDEKKEFVRQMTKTKVHTESSDVAEAFVYAAKNKSVTGQKLQVDSGLLI